jgi:hypothetical protein
MIIPWDGKYLYAQNSGIIYWETSVSGNVIPVYPVAITGTLEQLAVKGRITHNILEGSLKKIDFSCKIKHSITGELEVMDKIFGTIKIKL